MRRKRSGGRRKGTVITPKRIVKAFLVFDGVRRAWDAGAPTKVVFWATHPGQAMKDPKALANDLVPALAIPVAEILIAPKVVDKVVSLISKGEPALGRIANVKIVKV